MHGHADTLYAVVEDTPATWEHYERLFAVERQVPPGLILHVAGRTDEGFRVIEVWRSRVDLERFRAERPAARHAVELCPERRRVRELVVDHVLALPS